MINRSHPVFFLLLSVALLGLAAAARAQSGDQAPTPVVISLTPPSATATATAVTPEGGPAPDALEPNDTTETAAAIGLGTIPDLTLGGDDVDYLTGYLKAGQWVRISTAVYEGLDTVLTLYWAGQPVAGNDDRSAADVGSAVSFAAPGDGWYVAKVAKATVYDGRYDLTVALVEPTATPTVPPTATPTPTLTPTPSPTPAVSPDVAEPNDAAETAHPIVPGMEEAYTLGDGDVDHYRFIAKAGGRYACETMSDEVDTLLTVFSAAGPIGENDDRAAGRVDSFLVWTTAEEQAVTVRVEARGGGTGDYRFRCAAAPAPAPPVVSAGPPLTPAPTPSVSATMTSAVSLTATAPLTLTLRRVGRVPPQATATPTHIRLLVYYDANNDRTPGPGEGVPDVSVLAVDARGGRLAQVFTDLQGEAIFNLNDESVARVVVPFVPGWSARVRPGERNDDIVLGLPAVRLPVFLPVQASRNSD